MKKHLKVSFMFTLVSTLGLGIIYPFVLTGIGFLVPPSVDRSTLLTSAIQNEDLFQPRPSMSGGAYSGASNLSLTNPELWKQVDERLNKRKEHPQRVLIPRELLFASASGYDPHISIQGALHQIPRIARARGLDMKVLKHLLEQHTEKKLWGFIGAEKVNVITLNKSLEALSAEKSLKLKK